jgi:hypothetical protein
MSTGVAVRRQVHFVFWNPAPPTEKGLRFRKTNHPGSIRQGPLGIEALVRLWDSAVHGRKDKDRP